MRPMTFPASASPPPAGGYTGPTSPIRSPGLRARWEMGEHAMPAAPACIAELSGGRSVEVNPALLENNTRIASRCAAAHSKPRRRD